MCRHWGLPDSVTQGMRARASRSTSPSSAITAFAHDLTNVIYRRDPDSGDARKDLDALIARYAPHVRFTRAQVGGIIALALDETHELFVTANVKVDELRMKQLSAAACTALGVTSLGTGDWSDATETVEAITVDSLRDQLRQELESKVDPASGCDLGQLLLLALEGALRGAPFDRVVACVLSPDRMRLRARSGLGVGVEALLAQFDFPMTPQGGPLPAALLQGRTLYLPVDRAMNTLEQRLAQKVGVGQFGIFPIIVDGQIVGCVYGDRVAADPQPDVAARQHVEALTALVVQAIEARRNTPPAPHAQRRATRDVAADEGTELTADELTQLKPETKAGLVMQLLQGDTLVAVSSRSGVPAVQLEVWRNEFLAGAMARLAGSPSAA
jgi:hypothetical protein